EIMSEFTIHACTDITGFGLTGHAFQLAQASSKGLLIESDCLPYYEEALYFAKKGVLTRADRTNRLYVKDAIWFERTFSKEWETLFFDPQTSGGLFISLPEEEALPILKKFHAAGLKESRRIGSVFRSDRAILRFI
ncbi:MAG: AIR synthase-related protein, partial [Deltaproteobacteria bacterium]